jgi:probable F420-dependent oxidoreductase
MIRSALGIWGLENLFGGDFRGVIDVVRRADALGVDQVVMTDHVVMGERTDRYPYGTFPLPPEAPWFEPLLSLAAMASVTSRIRLSTSVLIAPLRPAALLAKQAATLDRLSGGRLDLGVGTGWQREEYEASGIPFARRAERLVDQLRACQALWRDSPAHFSSETVRLNGIHCRPAPVQAGGVPLWFGLAASEVNCRRIAELGVGWIPIAQDPKEIARGVSALRRAFEKAGRDPAELLVRAQLPLCTGSAGRPDLDATLAGLESTVAAGVTHIEVLPVLFCRRAADLDACLLRIARLRE